MQIEKLREESINIAVRIAPHRPPELFKDFLTKGYELFQLSSVATEHKALLHLSKLQLGILITLLDDLVDHPKVRNPNKLKRFFCRTISDTEYVKDDCDIFKFYLLFKNNIKSLPNYSILQELFEFDFENLKQALMYSNLIFNSPFMSNQFENRRYISHNMGILLALTLDLMCVKNLNLEEIAPLRKLFYEIQETTRLMNVLMSLNRELVEKDITNELLSRDFPDSLTIEKRIEKIKKEKDNKIKILSSGRFVFKSFDFADLIQSLKNVDQLHSSYSGVL